jgi:Tol biopolymer transport system component
MTRTVVAAAARLVAAVVIAVPPSLSAGDAPSAPPPTVRGLYFGSHPPGETPELFAPEWLGRFGFVARIAFSPDGDECLLTITDATYSHPKILYTRRVADVWTEPVVPEFADEKWINHEPFFSADGQRVYFTSDRDPGVPTNRRDLWVVERKGQGWGDPVRLPRLINSDSTEFFLSQASDGTLYFASDRPGGLGALDIYRARLAADGKATAVENLGVPVNTAGWDSDPCIAPDQSFLVFPGGPTGADLYVSFRRADGGWTEPRSLGEAFNTEAAEYAPALSPDGQFLFFARHDGKRCQLYWVRASVLARFRPDDSRVRPPSPSAPPPSV